MWCFSRFLLIHIYTLSEEKKKMKKKIFFDRTSKKEKDSWNYISKRVWHACFLPILTVLYDGKGTFCVSLLFIVVHRILWILKAKGINIEFPRKSYVFCSAHYTISICPIFKVVLPFFIWNAGFDENTKKNSWK